MPIELSAPLPLTHSLQAVVPAIRKFRAKQDLFASDLWKTLGAELERVAGGLEYFRHPDPAPPVRDRFVRAVSWNIERGKRFDAVMDGLSHELIRDADIVILNEVDIGMARSGQRSIAGEVARRLRMHYVFGNHYLCLDRGNPRDTLVLGRDGAVAGTRDDLPDEENSLGLHGNCIFSRYPLVRAENVPLFETKDKFRSRSDKRFGVKKALWTEAATPLGPLAIAAVHLDSIASPANRARQLESLLARLDELAPAGPLLIGGDWNTTTYDLQTPLRLAWNLLKKFWRGGFAHAVPQYMTPYEIYDRPEFDTAERHGFDWRSFNNLAQSTTVYDVEDPEAASMVRDHVGSLGVKLLRWRLAPWNGRAPLKVDWFAGRNLGPAGPDPVTGALAPLALERFRPSGRRASDHDPIIADVKW